MGRFLKFFILISKMNMEKRRLKKAIKRIKNLPAGLDLLKYGLNKLHTFYLKKFNNTRVAYPSTLMVEVTNHCNLKCITCPREYYYGSKMDKGFLQLESFKKIFDEAYPFLDSIGLTGLGETFLYKNLINIVDYIRSKSNGIIISVSINATLNNTEEIASKLVNKIDTIQISIDGLDEVYNQVRINGQFNKFIANVRKLVKLTENTNTDIMFNVVILKENYKQMASIVKFAHNEKIKYLNFAQINLVSITSLDETYYEFFDTGEFQDEFAKAKIEAEKYREIEFTHSEFSSKKGFGKCMYPWGHFYVTWAGYMPPCCAKPFPKELNFGNIFENKLIDVLNTNKFQEFRQTWLSGEKPEFCKKCL